MVSKPLHVYFTHTKNTIQRRYTAEGLILEPPRLSLEGLAFNLELLALILA